MRDSATNGRRCGGARGSAVTELTLHNYELDEQCYKVRLFLSALGCRYVKVDVDVHPGHEERSARYRILNPLGALPIITEGALVLYGAEAILVFLARKYDAGRTWLREDPATSGESCNGSLLLAAISMPRRWRAPTLCWKLTPTKKTSVTPRAARSASWTTT